MNSILKCIQTKGVFKLQSVDRSGDVTLIRNFWTNRVFVFFNSRQQEEWIRAEGCSFVETVVFFLHEGESWNFSNISTVVSLGAWSTTINTWANERQLFFLFLIIFVEKRNWFGRFFRSSNYRYITFFRSKCLLSLFRPYMLHSSIISNQIKTR